ncbi:MAG: hypothetical protein ACYDA3_13160 [Gaiellaceae bacterium]
MNGRSQYQREVERLLAEITGDTHRLWVAKLAGARGPALVDRKQELREVRRRLARLTEGVTLQAA